MWYYYSDHSLTNKAISLPSSHLFLQHVTDDMADLLKVRRVFENLLLAGLDDIVHGFQDAHHNLALMLCSHRFHKARKHHIQQFQEGWGRYTGDEEELSSN